MTIDDRDRLEPGDSEPSAAELAEAAVRLRALPAEEVVPLRPDWVEGVVAAARRAGTATNAGAAAGVGHSGWRRLVAAVVATIGLQGAIAAAAVTTAGAVAAVVLVWTAGHHSNETMSFRRALDVLVLPEQPQGHRNAALKQVFRRTRAVVEALREVQGQAGSPIVRAAAEEGLLRIREFLTGAVVPQVTEVSDTLAMSLPVLCDPAQDPATRLEHLGQCMAVVSCGLAAINGMQPNQPAEGLNRSHILQSLLKLAAQ